MQFRRKRREKKIHLRALCDESKRNKEFISTSKKELRDLKYAHNILKDLHSGFYIYDDKVLFLKLSKKEQSAVMIQDKELVKMQTRIFDEMWKIKAGTKTHTQSP